MENTMDNDFGIKYSPIRAYPGSSDNPFSRVQIGCAKFMLQHT